jgi:TonB family protein
VRSYENCLDVNGCAKVLKSVIENHLVNPSPEISGLEVKLRVKIGDNKMVISVVILESSGNREFDMSGVEAIKLVRDFRELNGLSKENFDANFKQFVFAFKPDSNA